MKYHNKKIETDDGKFDSLKEWRRWEELKEMEARAEIYDLARQVKFELIPKQKREDGTTERAVNYIADFVYFVENEYGGYKRVVEDVKPTFRNKKAETRYKATAAYKVFTIKRKLMLMKKIDIREV